MKTHKLYLKGIWGVVIFLLLVSCAKPAPLPPIPEGLQPQDQQPQPQPGEPQPQPGVPQPIPGGLQPEDPDSLSGGSSPITTQECTESEFSASDERIGVMRSTDGGNSWDFLGHACFHAPTLAPVDISPIMIGDLVALYFVDLMSFAPGSTRILYRAFSSDGVLFSQPVPVYSSATEQFTDPYVLKLDNSNFIVYLSDPLGIRVLVGNDQGAMFTSNGMISIGLSVPGALEFPDGSVRLFGGMTPTGSDISDIYSATSMDGLTNFILDSMPTIEGSGDDKLNDAHPIALLSGGYLMAYKVHPSGVVEDPAQDLVYLATSADGYKWTGGQSPIVKGSVPSIVELADGTLLLYYVDFNN